MQRYSLLLLLFCVPAAQAAVPDFSSTATGSFNSTQSQQYSGIFSSCGGLKSSTLSGMMDLTQDLLNKKSKDKTPLGIVTLETQCPSGDGGVTEALDCTSIGTLEAHKTRNLQALLGLKCQKAKVRLIQDELKCLSMAADSLKAKMASLDKMFSDNLARQQSDVAKMDANLADRDAQIGQVRERLDGGKSGAKGLRQFQAELKKLVEDSMPGELETIKTEQHQAKLQREQLEEWIEFRKVALAGECFGRVQADLRCQKNGGPPVTLSQFAVCRYRQNQHLGKNGKIQYSSDGSSEAKAGSGAGQLESLLAAMMLEFPKSSQMPTTPEELSSVMGGSRKIMTPKDFQTRYGASLKAYNGKGLNISEFLTGHFNRCYNESVVSVSQERQSKSSQIGRNQEAIKQFEKTTSAKAEAAIQRYRGLYTEAMKTLTGRHLTAFPCGSGPAAQVKCMTDAQNMLKTTLEGSTPGTTMINTISGNSPKSRFQISCAGITGCITAYESTFNQLETLKKKETSDKESYIQKANSAECGAQNCGTMGFTKAVAGRLSIESQFLQDRQKAMNLALSSIPGVDALLKIGSLPGEDLEIDEKTGLYRQPKSILNVLSGQMKPPMMDVDAESFGDAARAISAGGADVDKKTAELTGAMDGWEKTKKKCEKENIAKSVTSYNRRLDKLIADCKGISGVCEGSKSDSTATITNLLASIKNITGADIDPDEISSLETGVGDLCNTPVGETDLAELNSKLSEQKVKVEGLKVKYESEPDSTVKSGLFDNWNMANSDLSKMELELKTGNENKVTAKSCKTIYDGLVKDEKTLTKSIDKYQDASGAK